MFVDAVMEILPFLALGALVVATLVAALGALRSARRCEQLGEDRLELLRDQHERLELLREERRTLREELELEREGRLHNHRERQRLAKELEHVGLARSEDKREARREAERLEGEVRRLAEELELLWGEQHEASKSSKNGLWGKLFGGGKDYR